MSFEESAKKGSLIDTFRFAAVAGSLWAVGSSWALAIRHIVLEIMPTDTNDVVLAELGAAAITTAFGVAIAVIAGRYCRCHKWKAPEPPPPRPILAERPRRT